MLKEKETKEIKHSNVIPFVKLSNKPPQNGNWLKDLPLGTYFMCKPKNSFNYLVQDMHKGGIMEDYVILREMAPTGQVLTYWVDSQLFSNQTELVLIKELPDESDIS